MEYKKELLKPKIDIVFHSLFREGNEDITKAIITAVTKEKIEKINLNNDRHLIGKYPEEKLGILDLKATLNDGVICNIEVQLADNKDTAERFLHYWSRSYCSQLLRGDDYANLNKVIGIVILDYKFEKLREIESVHTKWQIKETITGKEITLTDVFELHIIEIPKAKRVLEKEANNEIAQWMMFLNNPNEEEVSEIMQKNEEIKKAMDKLYELSQDEELRRVAELREKAIRDEKNGLRHAREEGIKEGKMQGIKEGKKQGEIENKIETAKNLLKLGYPIDDVIQVTNLSVEIMQENKEIKEMLDNGEELRRVAELREKAIRDEKNGLRHAREDGIKEAKIEIARNLLKLGYPMEEIIKVTELSNTKLKELVQEINESK